MSRRIWADGSEVHQFLRIKASWVCTRRDRFPGTKKRSFSSGQCWDVIAMASGPKTQTTPRWRAAMRRSTTPRVCRWRNHHLRNSSRLPISESRLFSHTLRPAIKVKDCEMVWLRGGAVIEAVRQIQNNAMKQLRGRKVAAILNSRIITLQPA